MSGTKMSDNNFPKITVVTVTYNAELYLEQTIQSVVNQDYPNMEYIIIDGASTDGTVDIIKKYESQITYWISEPDGSIYYAMNKGIEKATGEWINFMNAGDGFYEKSTISNIKAYIVEETDIVSGAISYTSAGKSELKKPLGADFRYDGMFCWHQAMFTRTALMKKFKFDTNLRLAGDYDFTLKCYENGYKFKFIDLPIANFIQGGFAESNPILGRIEDMFIQSKYLKDLNLIFSKHSYSRLEAYKKTNNRVFARLLNILFKEVNDFEFGEKKIILYGYGSLGKVIYSLYPNNISYIIDQNYEELNKIYQSNQFHPHTFLTSYHDEFILLTILGRENEIKNMILENYRIDISKILMFDL
jgi:glycosyltransferase involved in cell wall biosynthesis